MKDRVLELVGRTPLVELATLSPRPGVRIFAKLEGQNPSGSIKDRVARGLIEKAEQQGRLKPGDTIVEATTGNTGIAIAMVGKRKGYRVRCVMPHGVVATIPDVLGLLGAEITWCEPRAGMRGAIETALRIGDEEGAVPLCQFADPDNTRIHAETTGAEIVAALDRVDAFVAGIGTGGTIMGAGGRLQEHFPEVRLVGVEPHVGERLQGLRSLDEGFLPPLLDIDRLHARYLVGAARALEMMHRVGEQEGLVIGVSGGACLVAALRYAEKLGEGNIVAMCSDGGWKYLPTRPWAAARGRDPELDETHWW